MIKIIQLYSKDAIKCYELDLETINLWSLNQWKNELKKEKVKALAIFSKDKIIGVCVLQLIIDSAEINFFSIHPDFTRKGFGSKLISALLNKCKQLEINNVFLEVSKQNIVALSFYNKFGFKTIGIRKSYYKDGSDAILKEKKLLKK